MALPSLKPKILGLIREKPGVTLVELSRLTDRKPNRVRHILDALEYSEVRSEYHPHPERRGVVQRHLYPMEDV